MNKRWQERDSHIAHRPNPVEVIPERLKELGEVFFPIPPMQKGWNYPHSLDEYRHSADSRILNAYLEQGWGYGIACAGDLVVVDVDELDYLDAIKGLPETLYQRTGSGEGFHFFYMVEGLNTRIILKDGDIHVGEIKCDPHGYVVGPGSLHPSGNIYGPLRGDSIATVNIADLLYELNNILPDSTNSQVYTPDPRYVGEVDVSSLGEFYTISADDVMPSLPQGKRIAHPVHGSTSGGNFMKNEGGDTFTCWRCQYGTSDGCVIAPVQYLAIEAVGDINDTVCQTVKSSWRDDDTLHYRAWKEAFDKGLVSADDLPPKVLSGYGEERGIIEPDDKLTPSDYLILENALLYEITAMGKTNR